MRARSAIPVPALSLAALLALAGPAGGGEESSPELKEKLGRKVMAKNREMMTAKYFKSVVSLLLVDRKGRTQTRHLQRMSITGADDQEKYVIVFDRPPEVRKTAFLNIEHKDRDDDLWMYMPARKRTKRLSGTDLRFSWMGTLFTYKDLKREKLEGNRYELVRTERRSAAPMKRNSDGSLNRTTDKVDVYVIDAFPVTKREKDEQGYGRRRLWVRADNSMAEKVEYYDTRGKLTKTLRLSDMRWVGKSGKCRAYVNTLLDRKGKKSIIKFEEIHINEAPISSRYFTKRYIERGR
jgi:hypothetical protein